MLLDRDGAGVQDAPRVVVEHDSAYKEKKWVWASWAQWARYHHESMRPGVAAQQTGRQQADDFPDHPRQLRAICSDADPCRHHRHLLLGLNPSQIREKAFYTKLTAVL